MNKISGIIYEAAKAETFNTTDLAFANELAQIEEDLDAIKEMDQSIVYTAEMVPVIACTEATGERILCVEADNLVKYMEGADLEIGELEKAIEDIAAANGIPVNDIAIVVESTQTCDYLIQEAKKNRKTSKGALNSLKSISDLAKKATTKGLKVFKRKTK